MIRKKEIVEQVVSSSGLRKRDVREALDQAFAFIRTSLEEGEEIDCPPLGKIKVRVQGPNSDNPKSQFRVVLRRDQAKPEVVERAKDDHKIHKLPLEAVES